MFRLWITLVLGLLTQASFALGPHELLVLANRNSTNSMAIARDYAALRHVPTGNVVALDLPAKAAIDISPEAFGQLIWEPALKVMRERGLTDHILAWAYSADFPVRIMTDPPLSIQGITFLRGHLPPKEQVVRGLYLSPFFAGPDGPHVVGFPSQSFDRPLTWDGKDMPMPSMMLGFSGPRGNTREEIMACLRRGIQSDGSRPDGTVYFVTNSNVRSRCRVWEFAPVVRELREQGVQAIVTPVLPDDATAILGVMIGAADVSMSPRRVFLPGAMAEHLTSFGAAFDVGGQTKITEWIRAGATASAGTVAEPLSLWTKFPHARFFNHLAAGCTLLESFYQSLRCPLQILLMGDPLAAPWAPESRLSLQGLESGPLRGPTTVKALVKAREGELFDRFAFLLDGRLMRPAGREPGIALQPAGMPPGTHALRAVAYEVGSVRGQIFAEQTFTVGAP